MAVRRRSGTRRICLVTSSHISYNPRLVKEADALEDAGFSVRVVSVNAEPAKWKLDQELMTHRSWELTPVVVNRPLWFRGVLRQQLSRQAARLRVPGCEAWSFSRYYGELARLAATRPTDLFIAHNLQALPAAFRAAAIQDARLGFDAEDFHSGELPISPETEAERRLVASIERRYLPYCDYITAASPGIAKAYAELLGIHVPSVILNTFPLSHRRGATPPAELARERKGDGLSMYWYSQVIGPDRGLVDAVKALALLRANIHLHIRGAWANGYERELMGLVRSLGLADFVHVLPPVPPQQLVERSAQHDIGLAAELGHTPNRRIAVTNKILNYLLAGLAIAATDIPAQKEILAAAPDSGFLYRPGDSRALADGLKVWVDSPAALQRVKAAARRSGESRFCWDREKEKFLAVLENVFRLRPEDGRAERHPALEH